MNNGLRVTAGLEHVAAGFEFLPDLPEVVDLPVEDDANAAVFIEYGLFSGGEVYDAQPAMAQVNRGLQKVTPVIRARGASARP